MDACIIAQATQHGFHMEKVVEDTEVGGGLQGCVYELTWRCTVEGV